MTVSDHWFETVHPDGGAHVRWENGGNVRTVALFVAEKALYLIGTPTFAFHDRQFGCPQPPLLLYRFDGHQWERVDLVKSPVKRLTINMTSDVKLVRRGIVESGKHLSAEQAARMGQQVDDIPKPIDISDLREQRFACR